MCNSALLTNSNSAPANTMKLNVIHLPTTIPPQNRHFALIVDCSRSSSPSRPLGCSSRDSMALSIAECLAGKASAAPSASKAASSLPPKPGSPGLLNLGSCCRWKLSSPLVLPPLDARSLLSKAPLRLPLVRLVSWWWKLRIWSFQSVRKPFYMLITILSAPWFAGSMGFGQSLQISILGSCPPELFF